MQPVLNKTSKSADVLLVDNMLFRRKPPWEVKDTDNGLADCLWRTSLGFIAYEDSDLIQGIMACYVPCEKKTIFGTKKYVQAFRSNKFLDDYTVSRDQVVMSLSALKVTDRKIYKHYAKKLRFKLSKKSFMTPDMWIWVKYMAGNKLAPYAYCIIAFLTLLVSNTWNWIVRKALGYKDIPQSDWNDAMVSYAKQRSEYSEFKKQLHRTLTPTFSYHLTTWMVFVLPDNWFKKPVQWLLRYGIEKSNILLQMLNGRKTTIEQIMAYNEMIGAFRPQSRLDGSSSMYIANPTGNEVWRIKHNQLAKDVMISMHNKMYKK